MCLYLERVRDVLFDMTAFFVCSYLFISVQWLTKDRSGSFWCSVGNYLLIWHPNWLGISYYIKEFSSWIAQQSSIGTLQQEDKNEDVRMNQKRRTIKRTFLCCDSYTRLIIFFPLLSLPSTLCFCSLKWLQSFFLKTVAPF